MFKTKEERMSAFMGCWQMAMCEGDLTEKDREKFSRVVDYIGLTEEELTQCLEHPDTVEFLVPNNPKACQSVILCLIFMAMEDGKIGSVKQALMLDAACNSYGVSDVQCSSLIQQHAAEETQNQAAS